MERTCEVCGARFEACPTEVRHGKGRFCSLTCKGIWQTRNRTMLKRMCQECGKVFEEWPCRIRRGFGQFCSRACRGKWQSRNGTGPNSPSWKGGLAHHTCQMCGTTFEVHQYRAEQARFCSIACKAKWQSEHMAGENHPNWQGGLSLEPYGADFSAALKQAVRQRDNFTCQLCGKPENGECHPVHHIDYDKKNNTPGNLITLCRSCHSKTNTGRGQWTKTFAEKVAV